VEVLNREPTAYFSIESIYPYELGTPILFNANQCNDTESDIPSLRYLWNFGDGVLAYGKIVSHTYWNAGIYNVSLTVKDDDGKTATYSRNIQFKSTLPQVNLEDVSTNHTFLEGDPVLFKATGSDDSQDIIDLLYYWNFDSEDFNPKQLDGYTLGGRLNHHYFQDDFEGNITAALLDSDGNYAVDSTPIRIMNVAPELRFYNAYFMANLSFAIIRNTTESNLNTSFLIHLEGDNTTHFYKKMAFSENSSATITTGIIPFPFLAQKDWNLVINSTCNNIDNTEYEIQLNLTFPDNQLYSLSSGIFTINDEWSWIHNLNSLLYNNSNYGFTNPLSLSTQVFDPSIDELDFILTQSELKEFIISAGGVFHQDISYVIGDISYEIHLYEQEGQQIASIYAEKAIDNSHFVNNSFPVNKDIISNLDELIDIYAILENTLKLSDVNVLECLEASILIKAEVSDDDGGYNSSYLTLSLENGIVFDTLDTRILHDSDYEANPAPFGVISSFLPTAFEGEKVKFTSKINADCVDLHYKWDFSDGYTLTTSYAEHAWQKAGVYNITFTIADAYGNMHTDIKNITILPKAPEIKGPFAFQTTEGTALVLDIEVYDSERDEANLQYSWYNEQGKVFSNDPKPKVILDDGKYQYTLVISDASGESASETITINVHSLAPKVFIGNYMYHGLQSGNRFTSDGEIELRAWAIDTFYDMNILDFYWEIRKGKDRYVEYDNRGNYFSDIIFTCKETGIYQGKVTAIDPEGNKVTQSFTINCVIDTELNGVSDNVEEMLRLAGNSTSDVDEDGLTDNYEQTISNTSYLDPDTDGDGLWDGYTINSTLGELSFETDNLDYDSDDDLLADGNELYGWNVSVVYFENSSSFHVFSDPLDNNSDSDGLTDYEEFLAGTHPQIADTDNDLLNDDVDPFPTKWDGDEDTLSDYWEIEYGTDPNNTDSDQDGLKDGDEVYGWGLGFFSNPLDADSDHDFVSDSAEIKNYLVKLADENFDDLDKKVNLSSPVSLHFPHHFTQASAAQISFGISFGEYGTNTTGSYGVPEEDVIDLNIIIVKKDSGVILANFSTNNTRYFSQVVDITEFMHNESLDYYGDYEIGIGIENNGTSTGHYPGTFSFEEDANGEDPEGWTDFSVSPSWSYIEEEIDGHTKVVKGYDGSSGSAVNNYQYWDSSQSYGTIEAWMRSSDASKHYQLVPFSGGSPCLAFAIDHDKFRYEDSGGWHDISGTSASDNTWYHVRIDFETTTGSYMGLSQWKWRVFIDGEEYGDFNFNSQALPDRLRLYSLGSDYNYYVYYDAISYSWDVGYEIGDNNEEIVLEYVFYKTGSYESTYSFSEDAHYSAGTAISMIDEYHGYVGDYTDILALDGPLADHNHYLNMRDCQGSKNTWGVHNFDNPQSSGTIEFFTYYDHVISSSRHYFYLRSSDNNIAFGVQFDAYNDYLQYYDGSWHSFLNGYQSRWLHHRIIFDCNAGSKGQYTWVISYENGTEITRIENINFANTMTTLDEIYIGTTVSDYRGTTRFDAFGFSWDPDYEVGDNLINCNPMCYLEYFELDFSRYLDPNDPDCDNDGILDGVEMGVLVEGTDSIQVQDYYASSMLNTTNPIGLLAHWTFEEGTGSSTTDAIGSYTGTLNNMENEDWVSGKLGEYALDLDGSNEYISTNFNTPSLFSAGDPIHISVWFKTTASSGFIIAGTLGGGPDLLVDIYTGGQVRVRLYGGTTVTSDSGGYNNDEWHIVDYGCDGSTSYFYVDGGKQTSSPSIGSYNRDTMWFGARYNSPRTYFDGQIDEVRVYDRALSEKEITEGLEILNVTLNPIGDYVGTYSFEEEEDGTSGTNIDFIDEVSIDSSCSASIVSEFEYHNKILELSDDNSGGDVFVYNKQFERNNGTIEFWWAQTSESGQSSVELYDGDDAAMSLYMRSSGDFSWYDGSHHNVRDFKADTWYHHKIVFNCSAGTKGKFDWYIDGELEAENFDFRYSCEQLDELMIRTATNPSGFDVYIDAIGYCWYMENVSYYWEGENLGESIPDSSEIGHYPGTYSFTEDTSGQDAEGWSDSTGSPSYAYIIDNLDGHNKVYKGYDGGTNTVTVYQNWAASQSSGTVEIWMRSSDSSKYFQWLIFSGYYTCFGIAMDNSKFQYYDSSGLHDISGSSAFSNTWYHVRIDFETTTGSYMGLSQWKWRVLIDGEEYGEYNYYSQMTPNKMGICSKWNDEDYSIYWDAVGYSWSPNYEIGDNCHNIFPELDSPDEFYLEIPQVGEVTDAQLDLELCSIGTPTGSGKVFLQLVKDVLNQTKEDIYLLQEVVAFDTSGAFNYSRSLNLGKYATAGSIYGTYQLQIKLYGTQIADLFNLTMYKIETNTYILADFENTIGWVTDPSNNDTDGDGWSDSYEIFTSGTSPLSKDSDGDEANDPQDRDPLNDVMLEIHPYRGDYNNLGWLDSHALMQIVVAFSFGDNDYYIVTPVQQATSNPNIFGAYQKGYFNEHYYINIDDDTTRQGNTITMNFQLYSVYRHLGSNDIKGIDEDVQYTINTNGEYTTLDASNMGIYNYYNYMEVKVKTVFIEKANTIAIFEANSTFNGHYNNPNQRYSLIQLNIPGPGHYFGSESFFDEPVGNVSTNINFVTSDSSSVESYVKIYEEIEGHSQVLGVSEGANDHSDFYHQFSNQYYAIVEWWWYSTKANGGILSMDFRDVTNDVIRLYIRDGKIKYHDGSYHDVMSVSSDTWYRMKLIFSCDLPGISDPQLEYKFELYVDGVLKVSNGEFVSNQGNINRIGISTSGDPFTGYFDAFGYSWDSSYSIGDNEDHLDCSGTPFEHGMNVIVIPTELFTQTLLNGYVEHGTLNETVLYHENSTIFEFTGPDRDGASNKANADVDFVFIRHQITPEDALEVLDLVLYGITNETMDENNQTLIHSYVSTKLNDTKATQMNLPYSILGYIPWVNNYTNSAMGDEPEPSGAFDLLLWVLCLVNPILRVVLNAQMAMTGGAFFAYLKDFLASIFMQALGFLAQLLWVIARTALLVLFYILLAIEFLFISINILILGVPLLIISAFSDFSVSFGLNFPLSYSLKTLAGFLKLENNNDDDIIILKYITWKYWEFFDLYVPWIVSKTIVGDAVMNEEREDIFGNSEEVESQSYNNTASQIQSAPILFNNSYSLLNSTHCSFRIMYKDLNFDTPSQEYGVKLHLVSPNGTALNAFSMECIDQDPDYTSPLGVNYSITIDISSYDEGLWHYFFSSMDGTDNNVTVFPYTGYLTGPMTCNETHYLWDARVTRSEYYFDDDGWANNNFNFLVSWWEPVNYTEPTSVNLCLIPANISLGLGVNRTTGIQKFEMEPVESEPDYSGLVQYKKILNFSNIGYPESELGYFYYYFEAINNENKISLALDYDETGPCHKKLLVKTSSSPVLEISSKKIGSSANAPDVLSDGSLLELKAIYTDSDTNRPDNLTVTLTNKNSQEEITYNMTNYYNSDDGETSYYYLAMRESDIPCGSWFISVEALGVQDQVSMYSTDISLENFVITVLGDTLSGMDELNTMLNIFGVIPMIAHIISLMLILAGSLSPDPHSKGLTLAGNILAVVTTSVLLTAAIIKFVVLIQNLDQNLPRLIGFAIGCMFISVFYGFANTIFKKDNPKAWVSQASRARKLLDIGFVFYKGMASILSIMSVATLLLNIFAPNGSWGLITGFASEGTALVRNSLSIIAMSILLGITLGIIKSFNNVNSKNEGINLTFQKWSMRIYAGGMLVLAIISFIIIGSFLAIQN